MRKNRLTSLLLAIVLLVSMAACTEQTPISTEPVPTYTMPPQVEVRNPVTYFSLSYGETFDKIDTMVATLNEDGSAYVDYRSNVRKAGDFDGWVLHGIADELSKTKLAELNGKDIYGQGNASASMFITFADGSYIAVGFTGTVPEEYIEGYNRMATYFAALTANIGVYVPQPMVTEGVDDGLLAEMTQIMCGTGIDSLDEFTINPVALDDSFSFLTGLSSSEGIAAAANCQPMMMTTAYSLVVVALENAGKASQVCNDFEKNLDWRKWVCVAPSDALLAQKDNMVLCLLAADELYTKTAAGITAAGWKEVKTLKNPDM